MRTQVTLVDGKLSLPFPHRLPISLRGHPALVPGAATRPGVSARPGALPSLVLSLEDGRQAGDSASSLLVL